MKKSALIEVNLIAEKGSENLFHKAYYLTNHLLPEGKILLGEKKGQKCRFCGKDSSETNFQKIAHIMPEFMGNKYAFSNYECDTCNEHFGKLEDSLSNFAGILNSFSAVKGKKGYSKFRGNKEDLEVFATDKSSIVVRSTKSEKEETFIYDKHQGKIFVDVNQPSYIPLDVYKALVKIAICLMDEKKVLNYKKAIEWLKEPNANDFEFDFFFTVFRKIGGEKRFIEPLVFLYEKHNSERLNNFPHHTLIIFYGIIQYQIFLPYHENDIHLPKENSVVFPLEQHLIIDKFENGIQTGITIDQIIMNGTEKVVGERNKFSVGMKEKK